MSRQHQKLNAGRWARVRRSVFERDDWRCVDCGAAGRLECDHVVSLHSAPGQDPYDVAGLQTLCTACHLAKTRRENSPPDPLETEREAWLAMRERLRSEIG